MKKTEAARLTCPMALYCIDKEYCSDREWCFRDPDKFHLNPKCNKCSRAMHDKARSKKWAFYICSHCNIALFGLAKSPCYVSIADAGKTIREYIANQKDKWTRDDVGLDWIRPGDYVLMSHNYYPDRAYIVEAVWDPGDGSGLHVSYMRPAGIYHLCEERWCRSGMFHSRPLSDVIKVLKHDVIEQQQELF